QDVPGGTHHDAARAGVPALQHHEAAHQCRPDPAQCGGIGGFRRGMALSKAAEAFRNISEVAEQLGVKKHVLRFWEVKFPEIKPRKRGGGRRLYRPADVELLVAIRNLLQNAGYKIEGVQRLLREQGIDHVKMAGASCATGAVRHERARRGAPPPYADKTAS